MLTPLPMAERHAFGLERLAEMSGKLVELAYQRARLPGQEPEAQERAMLLFDRLGRGFRMTIALEARMDRDRRRDAAGLTAQPAVAQPAPATSLPRPVAGPRPARPSHETEDEHEADLEPSGLAAHVDDLRILVADNADLLDPDGSHAAALEDWAAGQGCPSVDAAPRYKPAAPAGPGPARPQRRSPSVGQHWRASG